MPRVSTSSSNRSGPVRARPYRGARIAVPRFDNDELHRRVGQQVVAQPITVAAGIRSESSVARAYRQPVATVTQNRQPSNNGLHQTRREFSTGLFPDRGIGNA